MARTAFADAGFSLPVASAPAEAIPSQFRIHKKLN